MFHEVGPDEQNARGSREAVNDLGTKSLLSSEERRCGRPEKVDKRTHALVRYVVNIAAKRTSYLDLLKKM